MFDAFLRSCKPVHIDVKPLFDRYAAAFPPVTCELSFANVFCWAEAVHYLYAEHEGHLIFLYRDEHCRLNLLPPMGPKPEAVMSESFTGCKHYRWSRIPEHLAHTAHLKTKPVFERKNCDYVYDLGALRLLEGKKYDGKRNFIRRFTKLEPVVRTLTKKDAQDIFSIQEQWLESQKDNPSAIRESAALMKALEHYDALGLHGIGAFVGGKLAGFAIGEPLNATTFVEHFEKGLPEFTGVYPFVLREFAKSIPSSFALLNREQDLGIEGIRKAKESWNPAHLERKYVLNMTTD